MCPLTRRCINLSSGLQLVQLHLTNGFGFLWDSVVACSRMMIPGAQWRFCWVFFCYKWKRELSGVKGFPSVCPALDKQGCLMHSIDLTDCWKGILAPNWKVLLNLRGLLANPLSKRGMRVNACIWIAGKSAFCHIPAVELYLAKETFSMVADATGLTEVDAQTGVS